MAEIQMSRPSFRVTLLMVLVLTLTAWNILRLWTVYTWDAALAEFAGEQILVVIKISSAVWSLVGVIVAWSILRRAKWAATILVVTASAYSIWYWYERLVWQNSRPNWLFAVILNLALILFILFTIKSLSREAYERKIENPAIK